MPKKVLPDILCVRNLSATVSGKKILNDINIEFSEGSLSVIMGPNGSGKSTLAQVIMGNPAYQLTDSSTRKAHPAISLNNRNLTDLNPEDRARQGLFLAFQAPVAIPGVSVMSLLRTSYQALYGQKPQQTTPVYNPSLKRIWQAADLTLPDFVKLVKGYAKMLSVGEKLLARSIHDGFSGGEKKKIEMLQALILKPKFAIFDEIDTGLDVDALRAVASGISRLIRNRTGVIVITHYQRIIKYLKVDRAHIMINGTIVETGGKNLINRIDKAGFSSLIAGGKRLII